MERIRNHSRPAWLLVLLATTGFFFAMTFSGQAQSRSVTALVGGTLVDGYGSRPIRNSVIVIEGERIKAVGQVGTLVIPSGAEIISTEGMTVLPGLWDMHVHLMINGHSDYAHWDKTYPPQMESVIMPASARQLLMAGVTSARDLGAPLKPILAVRSRIIAMMSGGYSGAVARPVCSKQSTPACSPRRISSGRCEWATTVSLCRCASSTTA